MWPAPILTRVLTTSDRQASRGASGGAMSEMAILQQLSVLSVPGCITILGDGFRFSDCREGRDA